MAKKNSKKKKKQKNNNTKRPTNNKNYSVNCQESKQVESVQTVKVSEKTYFGFSSKTWSIILILAVVFSFVVFLIVPYTIGIILAAKGNNVDDFLSKINGFTIFLSIIGTAASIFSIIMSFIDKQRYSNEKEQSEKLFSEVKDLSDSLVLVSGNVGTIMEENHSIKLELLEIKDKIKMSKEIKDSNTGSWEKQKNSGEINDDKDV